MLLVFGTFAQCQLPCTANQCMEAACSSSSPYLCLTGASIGGCSSVPWNPSVCNSCCDYRSCFLPCQSSCTVSQCATDSCTPGHPFLCTSGNAAGQCGTPDQWSVAAGCNKCCDFLKCGGPTPAPAPNSCAGYCGANLCNNNWCSSKSPFLCTGGAMIGQCSAQFWAPSQCSSCCDYNFCRGPAPTAPQTPVPLTPAPLPGPTPAPPGPSPTSAPGTCGSCSQSWCSRQTCTTASHFVCTGGPAKGGCSDVPWSLSPSTCTECCDVLSCFSNCPQCNSSVCAKDLCPAIDPYVCTSGPAINGCSPTPWDDPTDCTGCCSTANCGQPSPSSAPPSSPNPTAPTTATPAPSHATPAPASTGIPLTPAPTPIGPVTPQPAPTPVPDWTLNPTPFPAPTPLPPQPPPATPIPSSSFCQSCSGTEYCKDWNKYCGPNVPFLCTSGVAGCRATPWTSAEGCDSCCDLQPCMPPAPTPLPPSPWDNVPISSNCALPQNGSIYDAPNPAATPYGGMDVSNQGCRVQVEDSCCGETPRFNWILATCHEDQSKRVSMACNHTHGSTSRMELYYLHAYQWNAAQSQWVLDQESSVSGNGSIINWKETNLFVGGGIMNGSRQDWDEKYAPTTNNSGTNGLGPPGMMIVMSAKQFTWSSLYLLNQVTLNRGPGSTDNCWGSSAGELDFLEPPFWAGIELPADYLFLTVTANAGRCFPVEKAIPKRFNRECNDPNCCEMCACPEGLSCFGNPAHAGYKPMGCINTTSPPPPGTVFTVDSSNASCSRHYGGVAGGAASSAFFAHDTDKENEEAIFVAVVDGDGVTVFRWPAATEQQAGTIWNGIGKYTAQGILQRTSNAPITISPPCTDWTVPCGIYEPSCDDECVILAASGTFGLYQPAGPYAAEAARDNLNWWNLFQSTGQTPGMLASQLPVWVDVPIHPTPLPFYCNSSCSDFICDSPTRCPITLEYECTSGDGVGGCSNDPTFWPTSPHCHSCCDARTCVKPCNAQCPPSACSKEQCGSTPFFCYAGNNTGQCSNSDTTWVGCISCCATASCP